MTRSIAQRRREKARLIILPSLLTAVFGLLLSVDRTTTPVQAFSAGPPAGHTGAPGEFTCDECHVPPDAGTGQIAITAPSTYVPGQTYSITVAHTNSDPTRRRWGFQLTVLDPADERAGNLQSTDAFTQVLDNQGPGGARQYVEHTATGTFVGQQGGASWTFNWTAPATDVGPVTFYAAGNHANNDGNSSGDNIYFTFVACAPASSSPDFAVSASPTSRSATPGNSAQYAITIIPLAGFTGSVSLNATALPPAAGASFNPATINITDASAKTSTLTITTGSGTPLGNYTINVDAAAGANMHSTPVTLRVISPTSVDLWLSKSASPNPAQVGLNLAYRLTVTNNGPAQATNVNLADTLPFGVTFASSSTTQGSCSGTATINCALGSLAIGASAIVTINVVPSTQAQLTNTASVSAAETDFDLTNNSATTVTMINSAAATPTMLDANLTVNSVVTGLDQPTSMAFLANSDFFVLEKATGKVQHVVNGLLQSPALDLAVNSASERGLLGIALHPQFAVNNYVYLFWSESGTGVDTTNVDSIAVLGNRVDRYVWNGSTLTFERNLIKLRSLQQDAGQPSRGNHDGGVLRFGQDDKLYVLFGDNGRRGFLQNVTSGGTVPDDQFGGPAPDNAHLTGVILRLNDDGSTPTDNPFFNVDSGLSGEAAANVKKVFAYGVRNSFGMAFDSLSGELWTEENGDDAFDEINRVRAGFNGGWVQIMGPLSRIADYKSIETTYGAGSLQQLRWPPSNIADTPQAALARLYMLPGAQYTEPEFSWKYAVAPSPLGFVKGRGLGAQFEGDMFVGGSRTTLVNGYLFRFKMSSDRLHFSFTDARLSDLVADNADKFDLTESENLLIGRDFGITTDIQTAPNGNVFVVSLSNGSVYEIKSKPAQLFVATLNGAQEVPPTNSAATGTATLILSPDEMTARVSLNFSGLSSAETGAHIHGPAGPGSTGAVIFPLQLGQLTDFQINLNASQVQDLKNGLFYINVHSTSFTNGEIRGQFQTSSSASTLQFSATKIGVGEGQGTASVVVTRAGNLTGATTVDYLTNDSAGANNCNVTNAAASSRCDYETTVGTWSFAAGETSKLISIPIVDDSYAEGNETFTITLSNAAGASLGSPSTATVTINDNETVNGANPIFITPFFVRQHYLDFLSREPEAGEPFTGILTGCPNVDNVDPTNPSAGCDRLNVSGQFFGSPEFRLKGVYTIGFYRLAFNRLPQYVEFAQDLSSVTGATAVETFAKRVAFANAFVQRPEFINVYPTGMSNSAYVNALMGRYSLTSITTPDPANPDGTTKIVLTTSDLINRLNAATLTRAQVLRAIVQSDEVSLNIEAVNVFVASQYYGYLRRMPEAGGFNDWVNYLNAHPGDFRTMVNGFMNSIEYRLRFGPP